jgi:hypothetical protein
MCEAAIAPTDELVDWVLHEVKLTTDRRSKAEHQRLFELVERFQARELSGVDPKSMVTAIRERIAGSAVVLAGRS